MVRSLGYNTSLLVSAVWPSLALQQATLLLFCVFLHDNENVPVVVGSFYFWAGFGQGSQCSIDNNDFMLCVSSVSLAEVSPLKPLLTRRIGAESGGAECC